MPRCDSSALRKFFLGNKITVLQVKNAVGQDFEPSIFVYFRIWWRNHWVLIFESLVSIFPPHFGYGTYLSVFMYDITLFPAQDSAVVLLNMLFSFCTPALYYAVLLSNVVSSACPKILSSYCQICSCIIFCYCLENVMLYSPKLCYFFSNCRL